MCFSTTIPGDADIFCEFIFFLCYFSVFLIIIKVVYFYYYYLCGGGGAGINSMLSNIQFPNNLKAIDHFRRKIYLENDKNKIINHYNLDMYIYI